MVFAMPMVRLSHWRLYFFQAYILPLQVSVRLELWLRLGLGFIFYIYFISTKPTAVSWCVTNTS